MDIHLREKVAVVTGGTTGIGLAIAELFAEEGAKVAICSRSEEKVAKALRYLEKKGLSVYAEAIDVSNRSDLFGFADRVENKFGGLDVWISNAGIYPTKKIIDTPDELWQRTLDVNLKSVYFGGIIAADKLKKRGGGVLINAASFATLMPSVGSGVYAATKAAIASMTRSLAAELAPYNIRVVAYIPGVIETPMTESWIQTKGKILASQCALQRIGTAEEVANVVLFLVSDKASYVTGTCVEITGGKFCVQNPQDGWT
jgi:3-oxoacyl-[acyl-carrier protein] reductase